MNNLSKYLPIDVDNDKNNVLHLVVFMSPQFQLILDSGRAIVQMEREYRLTLYSFPYNYSNICFLFNVL